MEKDIVDSALSGGDYAIKSKEHDMSMCSENPQEECEAQSLSTVSGPSKKTRRSKAYRKKIKVQGDVGVMEEDKKDTSSEKDCRWARMEGLLVGAVCKIAELYSKIRYARDKVRRLRLGDTDNISSESEISENTFVDAADLSREIDEDMEMVRLDRLDRGSLPDSEGSQIFDPDDHVDRQGLIQYLYLSEVRSLSMASSRHWRSLRLGFFNNFS